MKDAKGHGSNPRGTHAAGVESIKRPIPLHPNVISTIRQNPDGFSLRPKTGRAPDKGYMVSLPGRSKMLAASDLSGPHGQRIVSEYVQQNSDVLSKPGAHIGGWTDKASGITHLDVSHNVRSKDRAISKGIKQNQIAVWDVRRSREIRTGGTGG